MDCIYIPLGIDCSIAYQLNKHGLRYFALPFDWSYTKNLLNIIELIDNEFSNFLPANNTIDELRKLYEIIEIKTNNYLLGQPFELLEQTQTEQTQTEQTQSVQIEQTQTYSKYKLKHKKYNLILPHEFATINDEQIQIFIDKYKRRIDRFYKLNQHSQLIFIRLGTKKDLKYIDLLNETIKNKFNETKYLIKFINLTDLSALNGPITTNWKRDEYDWLSIFDV